MDLSIRPSTLEDLPKTLQLYQASGLVHDAVMTLADAQAWFQKLQQYPNYHLWMAEVSGEAVGTFALLIMDNLVHQGSPSGIVEGVAVAPEFQGRGIGRQMMAWALEHCRAAGCYKLSLSTNLKRDRAHAFYESLGFTKHGYSFSVDLK